MSVRIILQKGNEFMDWEKQYKQMVLNARDSFDDVNKFLQPYFPKFLYKYSGCNSIFWKDRLYKGELYFCHSNKLNDLFDGAVKIDLKKASREGTRLNQHLKQMLEISHKEKLDLTDEEIIKSLSDFREDIRIASLSEAYDSEPMWAHYGEQHKGFCIEYDVSKMSNMKKRMLFKVIYGEKPDITEQIEEAWIGVGLSSCIFKSEGWAYEKEWRMFKICEIEDADKKYYFRKEIKAVYIGTDCEEKNKKIIMDWARQENKEIYQMEIDYKEQKLSANRLI